MRDRIMSSKSWGPGVCAQCDDNARDRGQAAPRCQDAAGTAAFSWGLRGEHGRRRETRKEALKDELCFRPNPQLPPEMCAASLGCGLRAN